jgi:hypothetical protein
MVFYSKIKELFVGVGWRPSKSETLASTSLGKIMSWVTLSFFSFLSFFRVLF